MPDTKTLLNIFLQHRLLVSQDFFEVLPENFDVDAFLAYAKKTNTLFVDKNTAAAFSLYLRQQSPDDEDTAAIGKEGTKTTTLSPSTTILRAPLKIVFSYQDTRKQKDVQDFVKYFNNRFRSLEKILRRRQEFSGTTSLSRIKLKNDRETVYAIGIVSNKSTTKNKNIILTLEDPTGTIDVIVHTNHPDLVRLAKQVVLDEVIGIVGQKSNGAIFASQIFLPDVPVAKELKKTDEEIYALFLSDIHIGSIHFLQPQFEKFIEWINGDADEKHQELISKIRYLFIAGDIVDGVGVYPNQQKELNIIDILDQYKACAEYLAKIPKHIHIIICPGNHDAMRLGEPQLPMYGDIAKPIYELENVTMVSNPGVVNIAAKEGFPGFDVLMYHGYSFDYYISDIDEIRNNGGYDRADLVMKFLLQKRHLAPTHTSTLYIPDEVNDPLVIEHVPDFFITGHLHKTAVANYRNITMICGSCWQSTTPFQVKVGHHPEPCRVPVVNLKTREVKILRFG